MPLLLVKKHTPMTTQNQTLDHYLLKTPTLELLKDEFVKSPENPLVVLGFFGNSSSKHWNPTVLAETVLNPLASEFGDFPAKILIPTEGATSMYLQVWAEKNSVQCSAIDADWIRMGARARALRDSKVLKESNILVYFLGNRSDYYEKMAIREVKKSSTSKKRIFVVPADTKTIEEWTA